MDVFYNEKQHTYNDMSGYGYIKCNNDVGQKSNYFTYNKTKRRKRRAIKKSDWRIGNSRVNRLFATVISRKLMF